MTATVSEINTYFGRCRCCLSYGYLKNMWEEHYWDGEKEVYVEMLVQCFALSWEPTEDSKKYDQICEKCVTSLREANLFKKTVLESQLHLIEHIDEEPGAPIKTEQINVVECKEETENEPAGISLYTDETYEDPDDPDFKDPDDSQDMDYEDVEYLEDEDKDSTDTQKPSKIHRRKKTPSPPVNRKWPKKLPKSERNKTYKQDTEEELRACLEDVRNEKLTPKKVAEKYNVPRKTIVGKLRSDIKECDSPSKMEETNIIEFKTEVENVDEIIKSEYEDPDDYVPSDDPEYEQPHESESENLDDSDYENLDETDYIDTDTRDMGYDEVEYLEDEDNREALAAQKILRKELSPKKGKFLNNNKRRKKIPEQDLKRCIEAVRKDKLTIREASVKYNIPRTTLANHLKTKEEKKQMEIVKQLKHEKRIQFIEEIKIVLNYTNAIPYKSLSNKYCCAYCSTESPSFDSPDELRMHTKTRHIKDRIAKIENFLPCRLNEIIKIDIHNFECIKCCSPISDWNNMFKHLKDTHDIVLDQAYTKIIPYDLTDQLKCALCKKEFSYYMHLDSHMNAHYNNYVCSECGDTFLAETRLRRHVRTHNIEKYACSFCKKVFNAFQLKNKHEEEVHKQLPKFKCQFCDERFCGEYLRHMHLVEKHKEMVNVMTCEYCGKTFTWRPYYRRHKRQHTDGRRFACKECGRKYSTQIELDDHILRHAGKKQFICGICNKRYVSLVCLKRHIVRHT